MNIFGLLRTTSVISTGISVSKLEPKDSEALHLHLDYTFEVSK